MSSATLIRRMRLTLAMAALAASVAIPAQASAQPKNQFAHFFSTKPEKVVGIRNFELRGVRHFTHVLIGRYQDGKWTRNGVVLMRCNRKTCRGERVWLDLSDKVVLHRLVDLAGKPGKIHHRSSIVQGHGWRARYEQLGNKRKRLRWPALVLELRSRKKDSGRSRYGGMVSGTRRHNQLIIVSLRKGDRFRTVFQEDTLRQGPAGMGTANTYTLVKSKRRGRVLDIEASRQRLLDRRSACIQPKPTKHRYMLDIKRNRFVEKRFLGRFRGC